MAPVADLQDAKYRADLLSAIKSAVESGACTLEEIARQCRGAGLEVVQHALDTEGYTPEKRRVLSERARQRAALARRRAGQVQAKMPAPDPERAQWWFTLDAVERLSELIAALQKEGPIAFLGAPTVAAYHATRYEQSVVVLDADPHVLDAAKVACELPEELRTKSAVPAITTVEYNVRDPVPKLEPFVILLMDPPWYDTEIQYFASRARELLVDGGRVISSYPGELTRQGVAEERKRLQQEAFRGFSLLSMMPALLSYRIPHFEDLVHFDLNEYSGKPWRHADALLFALDNRTPKDGLPPLPSWTEPTIRQYAKNPAELRLFFARERTISSLGNEIEDVPSYSTTVSRRGAGSERSKVALWSSTKRGFMIRDAAVAEEALELWQRSSNKEQALASASEKSDVQGLLAHLYKSLELPADTRDIRQTVEAQLARHEEELAPWATRPTPRNTPEDDDGFRLPHARDRDRVVWSDGLKRLANKTQVFSLDNSDNVRQRLAHSIEVMQLAGTIGVSFRLDRDLIEAGALAHDIGHTPFGHAGEYALDVTLNSINSNLGGFNHYEHGVDVVRWLETPYRSPSAGNASGLNLTRAVCECIFKHTFCMSNHRASQKEIWERSKYRENWAELAGDKPCHLEGQAVRIADKISYLVSDLEDGFRLGVFTLSDLRRCRLFEHAPLDYKKVSDETDLDRFVAQRRALLAFLMEDVISATAKRLSRASWKTSAEYTVDHSDMVKREVTEVWERLQHSMLHQNARVISANLQASRIVSSLFVLFAIQPSLVDASFFQAHQTLVGTPYLDWYMRHGTKRSSKKGEERIVLIKDELAQDLRLDSAIGVTRRIGTPRTGEESAGWDVNVQHLVLAKDYVASLSDARARRLYHDLIALRKEA